MFDQPDMPDSSSSFFKQLPKKLKSDDVKLPLYFGIGLIALFLVTSSLAPEISRRLGQLSQKKEIQQAFAQDPESQIRALNEQLISQSKSKRGFPLQQLAIRRKELMVKLIEENPQKVFELRIPADIRAKLSQNVQPYIEQDMIVQGTLKILHSDDFENRTSRTRYYLASEEKLYSLHTQDPFPQVLSGSLVRVSGISIDNKLVFKMKGTLEVLQAAAPNAQGEQRLAVILVNFQDDTSQPVTKAQVQNLLSTEVHPYYKEASYNKFAIPGDVFGWYTLPINFTCDWYLIRTEALRAADADINFQNYKHIVYALPTTAACGFGGLAGGTETFPSTNIPYTSPDGTITVTHAWISAGSAGNISHYTAHELGHNLGGIGEAYALDCGAEIIKTPIFESNNCTHINYGDLFDVMGSARLGHFNAFHKETFGWFDPANIINATANGTYTIEPLETAGAGAKIIKIPWDKNSQDQPIGWLYLEFRQLVGFDAKESYLIGDPNPTNGVLIHYAYPITLAINPNLVLGYYSYLLDATPESQATEFFDPTDAALVAGKTFSNSQKGISISTVSKTSQNITVQVSFAALDTDSDGMPDSYEQAHSCLNPNVNDAALDPDADSLSTGATNIPMKNIDEYQKGTDPCNADTDGDGFKDGVELYVGTDPNDNCAPGTGGGPSPAWPADLVSSGGIPDSTNRITLVDLTSFTAPVRRMGTSPGDAGYDVRWDLVPGKGLFGTDINIQDLSALLTLAPPMFGGARAYNGPACTP